MISTVSDYNGHQVGQWYDSVPQLVNCDGKLGPVDYFCLTVINTLPEYIESLVFNFSKRTNIIVITMTDRLP